VKAIEQKARSVVVELNDGDLELINNALNEVCNGIEIPEFDSRLGTSKNQALELLREIGNALANLEKRMVAKASGTMQMTC
jgi:hypothetical protein